MNKRLIFLFISIGLLAAFYLFSREVKHGVMKQTDFDTTVHLQDKIPARLDQIMDDGAVLADGIVSSALVLGITAFLFYDWKTKKIRPAVLVIPVAFFLLGIAEIYGKNMLPHAGPPFFMVKHPATIFPKFTIIQPYSYPSGHAARSTFLAVLLLSLISYHVSQKKKTLGRLGKLGIVAIVGYAVFVYISRIYLGHHWLSDIIGGVLVGTAFGLLAISLLVPHTHKKAA